MGSQCLACSGSGPAGSNATFDPADHGTLESWPAPDIPLPVPNCGVDAAPGQTRVEVDGVIGRVAIDAQGTVFAPFTNDAWELGLQALDPCGRPLWQRIVTDSVATKVSARLLSEGEVVLEAFVDGRTGGLWRLDPRDGQPLPALPLAGRIYDWVGADDTAIYLLGIGDGQKLLSRVTPAGETLHPINSAVGEDSCAVFGGQVSCYLVALHPGTLEPKWSRDSIDNIYGTTPPALTDERLYGLIHGASTYRAVAQSTHTGETLWSQDVGLLPSGQLEFTTGSAVIGENGWIYIYVAYRKDAVLGPFAGDVPTIIEDAQDFGWLIGYDEHGDEHWRLDVPTKDHAMHVAGRGGMIYLATSDGVWALDESSGEILWRRSDLGRLYTPRVALSPNGDLLVQSDPDRLIYVATSSAGGTADSPWPAPGGDRRNRNTR